MSTKRQDRASWLLFELIRQRRWIDDHGGSLAGYVTRYGAASDPDHYGAGGEAIYAADKAALDRLQAEYEAAAKLPRGGWRASGGGR